MEVCAFRTVKWWLVGVKICIEPRERFSSYLDRGVLFSDPVQDQLVDLSVRHAPSICQQSLELLLLCRWSLQVLHITNRSKIAISYTQS